MAAHKDEPRGLAGGAGLGDHGTTDGPDCASADAARKRFERLRALLALHHGHVVHELAGGGYLVVWRGLSRECADLAELEAHARRVGALR